jgi:hypothetical protein
MPGERGRLVGRAFHHVAITGDEERAVIHRPVAAGVEHRRQVGLGHREPDGVADPLAQRAGGDLDSRGDPVLGVSRRPAVPLAELLDVFQREIVAGEIQRAVQQHRGVARREHEAVAVHPEGVGRIVTQVTGEQQVGQRRQRHGGAGMSRLRLLHRIHREGADGIYAELVERLGWGSDAGCHGEPFD